LLDTVAVNERNDAVFDFAQSLMDSAPRQAVEKVRLGRDLRLKRHCQR